MERPQFAKSLPKHVTVACSGGIDSVALVLACIDAGKKVTVAHYVHDSDNQSNESLDWVKNFVKDLGLDLIVSDRKYFDRNKRTLEHWWRKNRHEFFKSLNGTVLTGHTLDDVVEWYLYTSFRGNSCITPYSNGVTEKPFIKTKKQELIDWMQSRHPDVNIIEDRTNNDSTFNDRNFVRLNILPAVLELNPGFYSTIKNKIEI